MSYSRTDPISQSKVTSRVSGMQRHSGPGHLAALRGVPTFTIFGPQLSVWFAPLHPATEWIDGKACPYKPCSDYCRFSVPICMVNSPEEEVWQGVKPFVARTMERGVLRA